MIRNLKALGLALLAVIAMGAVAVSDASAASFHSESSSTTIITAEGVTVFATKSAPNLAVQCAHSTYGGTQSGTTAASITVHPAFTECTSMPGPTTVDTHGCDYNLYAETTSHLKTDGVTSETDSPVEMECTAGKSIIVTMPCNITITSGAGEKLHGLVYDNEGAGFARDIKITFTVDGIKYTTPNTLACNLLGLPRNGTDGTLTGSVTAKGFEDSSFSKDPTTHTVTVGEGSQVGIWWE